MAEKNTCMNVLAVVALLLFLTSISLSTYYTIEEGYYKNDQLQPFRDASTCGPCLDLALERPKLADFAFIHCPENLKKWAIINETTGAADRYVWQKSTPSGTTKMVEDYNSIDETAFKGGIEDNWLNWGNDPRKVQYKVSAIVLVVLMWICSGYLCMVCMAANPETGAESDQILVVTISLLGISLFVWFFTAWFLAEAEVQHVENFNGTDCAVMSVSYKTYEAFRVISVIVFLYSIIWMWLSCMKDILSGEASQYMENLNNAFSLLCPVMLILGTVGFMIVLAEVPEDQAESYVALVVFFSLIFCLCLTTCASKVGSEASVSL